ncbi:hypothetical protein MASR1M66_01940 [Aminivibrio sp.]
MNLREEILMKEGPRHEGYKLRIGNVLPGVAAVGQALSPKSGCTTGNTMEMTAVSAATMVLQ